MKQLIVIGALAAMIVSGSMLHATTGIAQTVAGTRGSASSGTSGGVMHHRLGRLADVLGLTTAQRDQIRAIWKAEAGNIVPLRQELAQNRRQLVGLLQNGTFDEQAVRAIAQKQASTRTELIVTQARLVSEISAVLTPEQRIQAKKLYAFLRPERPWRRF